MAHTYSCTYNSVKKGEKGCLSFQGTDLDTAIGNEVLGLLNSPPIEMLRDALAYSRRADEAKKNQLETERQRLERRERLLRDQFAACDPKLHWVYNDLQHELNKVLEEKNQFLQRLNTESFYHEQPSESDLYDVCVVAKDVSKIWHHPSMTNHERKEIIRALIANLSVNTTKEMIEATVYWIFGGTTDLKLYRWAGRDNLIRELHAAGCTTREIIDRLARGETSTGQIMKFSPSSFTNIYKRLGLKPHWRPSWVAALCREALERRSKGETNKQIADDFNSRGLTSPTGRTWTSKLIFNLTGAIKRQMDDLDALHREVFIDARRRGLGCVHMAREFNARGIPRDNGRPWHKEAVLRKWRMLVKKEPDLRYIGGDN
jgi:hypothetical protein